MYEGVSDCSILRLNVFPHFLQPLAWWWFLLHRPISGVLDRQALELARCPSSSDTPSPSMASHRRNLLVPSTHPTGRGSAFGFPDDKAAFS